MNKQDLAGCFSLGLYLYATSLNTMLVSSFRKLAAGTFYYI